MLQISAVQLKAILNAVVVVKTYTFHFGYYKALIVITLLPYELYEL